MNFLALQAQPFQLFTEDFELTNAFTLNSGGPAAASGNNNWIVNDSYIGAPTYPNTMRQDSTYSGAITFAPFSKYLHIHNSASVIDNANFDPSNPSDNFAFLTNGLCTLGMDSVQLVFFYLCEGSSNAYGEVYYSINNGPWVQTGQAQYNNKYKWQYESIMDPVFNNQFNVRFGFRWVNGNSANPANESFSIDDVDIIATGGGAALNPVTCSVDSVVPNPVCQGNYIYIYWHLSDTLCDGSYTIQLSNATGGFPTTNNWIFNIYYPQTSGVIPIQLPNSVLPGTCYKIRINRTTPLPAITGVASACFTILSCPNTITTLQPVVTMDTNAVCIGSAIDIPFWALGVYVFNTYTAELSDSNGVFPAVPTVINSMFNSSTYDPALPPYQPGSISGIVPTVTPGCNYYIRVVSSNPVAIGAAWGPFCIRQCDIETNNNTDLHFCVTDCSAAPLGQNTTIPVGINTFDSVALYNPGNIFKSQLMSSMTFAQIGANGILGSVAATHDTIMPIHVPCKDSLPTYGIPLGMNYMRAIATSTTEPDDALGSLIRVTVGATHAVGPNITIVDYTTFTEKDTFCVGEQVYPYIPYPIWNPADNSTYLWSISGFNGGNPFQNPSGANQNSSGYAFNFNPGTYTFSVQETNNGCVGPWSPLETIVVLGPPVVTISGPPIICLGDTLHYSIPAQGVVTGGVWSATNQPAIDQLINSTNTETDAIANGVGAFVLTIQAFNTCGTATSSRTIQVKDHPNITAASAFDDTVICNSQPITLTTNSGTGYSYVWSNGGSTVSSSQTATVNPQVSTSYFLTVTGPGQCKSKDTIDVIVQTPSTAGLTDAVCPLGSNPITLAADSAGTSYLWSPGGETTQSITVNDTGVYSVSITMPGRACPRLVTFDVGPEPCPYDMYLVLPNVFSPDGSANNDFFTPITSGDFETFKIKIYDRWGLLMFESADPFFMWDGTHNGKKCPEGVYYYIANYQQAGKEAASQAGFLTLTRK